MPVGTDHGVEQVGPFGLPRLLVLEEAVQRSTGVGHLLHRLAGDESVRVTVPSRVRLTPRPAIGGTLGEERRPEVVVARHPQRRIGVSGHAKAAPE